MFTPTKKNQNIFERTFTKFGISSAVGYTFFGLFIIILGALAVAVYFIFERLLRGTPPVRHGDDLAKKYEPLVKALTAASFPAASDVASLNDLVNLDDKDIKDPKLKVYKQDSGDIKLVHAAISRMMTSKRDEFENQEEIDAWSRIKGKYPCFNVAEIGNAERTILTKTIMKLKTERDNAGNIVKDLEDKLEKIEDENYYLLSEWDAKSDEDKAKGKSPAVAEALQKRESAEKSLNEAKKTKNNAGIALGNAQKNLKALSVKPSAKPPGGKPLVPPTGVPPTGVPPTDVPPVPPTDVPPVPPTDVPPVPPTDVPPVPPTGVPPTDVPTGGEAKPLGNEIEEPEKPGSPDNKPDKPEVSGGKKPIIAIEDGDSSTWQGKKEQLEAEYTKLLKYNEAYLKENKDFHERLKRRNIREFTFYLPDLYLKIHLQLIKLLAEISRYQSLIAVKEFREKNPNPTKSQLEHFDGANVHTEAAFDALDMMISLRLEEIGDAAKDILVIINPFLGGPDPSSVVVSVREQVKKPSELKDLLVTALENLKMRVHNSSNPNLHDAETIKSNAPIRGRANKCILAIEEALGNK